MSFSGGSSEAPVRDRQSSAKRSGGAWSTKNSSATRASAVRPDSAKRKTCRQDRLELTRIDRRCRFPVSRAASAVRPSSRSRMPSELCARARSGFMPRAASNCARAALRSPAISRTVPLCTRSIAFDESSSRARASVARASLVRPILASAMRLRRQHFDIGLVGSRVRLEHGGRFSRLVRPA